MRRNVDVDLRPVDGFCYITAKLFINDLHQTTTISKVMIFNLKYVADWETIRKRKLAQMSKDNIRENSKRRDYTYKIGSKVLVKKDHLHILRKITPKWRPVY